MQPVCVCVCVCVSVCVYIIHTSSTCAFINYKLCNAPTHTLDYTKPLKNVTISGYCKVGVTDLVVLIQPTHAWRHLVHNSNLGGELVLHQVRRQVPTHKPNTCSEQTDYQTDRPADKRQSGGQTARQAGRWTHNCSIRNLLWSHTCVRIE